MNKEEQSPLGKETVYKTNYDPSLLFPIERKLGREKIGLVNVKIDDLPFKGFDIWNCFELSWLNKKGKPEVRIIHLYVPCNSPKIVESKSVKLYLNSFNNTKFEDERAVLALIRKDISKAIGASLDIDVKKLIAFKGASIEITDFECIDNEEIEIYEYEVSPQHLKLEKNAKIVEEKLYTNLLRSNCLVTSQPDWASVFISYKGKQLNSSSLL